MLRLEFEKPEDETQIILKEGKLVKAATREKLVERLTDEGAIGIAIICSPAFYLCIHFCRT